MDSLFAGIPIDEYDGVFECTELDIPSETPEGLSRRQGFNPNVLDSPRLARLGMQYFSALGYTTKRARRKSDNGGDFYLFRGPGTRPYAIVRCDAGPHGVINSRTLHELLSTKNKHRTTAAILLSPAAATKQAIEFANAEGITLFTGTTLAQLFETHPEKQAGGAAGNRLDGWW